MAQNQKNQGGLGQSQGKTNASATASSGTSKRGFASMDPEKQRQIASKGGKASHGGGNRSGGNNR